MRTGVLGGTGAAGSAIAAELVRRGHEVRVISRTAPQRPIEGAFHARADVATGAGLDAALEGLDVVVDALNGPPKRPEPVLVEGVRTVVRAAGAAGVGHLVCLSIVGCDVVPMRYYAAKLDQERLVARGGVPHSIVRATQFHGFVASMLAGAAHRGLLPAPKVILQPVDAGEVAAFVARAAEAGPTGTVSAFAGPDILPARELVRTWRSARGSRAPVVPLPAVGRALRAIAAGGLCDASAPRGTVTFAQWLARRA